MVTLVGSLRQTTFAAISFTGAGYLFKSFDKNGYEGEIEAFYQNEVKQQD